MAHIKDVILIIDDLKENLFLLNQLLTENGYLVIEANSGKEALKLTKQFIPDLIICDIIMPEMNGYEVFGKIKSEPRFYPVPFIILTAMYENVDIRYALGLGVDDYLLKPIDVVELLRVVEVRIKRKKNLQDYYNNLYEQISIEDNLLKSELNKAIEQSELVIHFQPKVHLSTNKVVGAEVFARWNHPERGWISPHKFIPLAEQSDLIVQLDNWVFSKACEMIKSLKDVLNENFVFTFNLSHKQFGDQSLIKNITGVLEKNQIPPKMIGIEILESIALRDVDKAISQLKQLKKLGAHSVLDNFGIGYLSFNYLKKFEFDSIKIDEAIICKVPQVVDFWVSAKAIIDMAHFLKIEIIAKGIEDEKILNSIKELKCEFGQGFHLGNPVDFDEFVKLLK